MCSVTVTTRVRGGMSGSWVNSAVAGPTVAPAYSISSPGCSVTARLAEFCSTDDHSFHDIAA